MVARPPAWPRGVAARREAKRRTGLVGRIWDGANDLLCAGNVVIAQILIHDRGYEGSMLRGRLRRSAGLEESGGKQRRLVRPENGSQMTLWAKGAAPESGRAGIPQGRSEGHPENPIPWSKRLQTTMARMRRRCGSATGPGNTKTSPEGRCGGISKATPQGCTERRTSWAGIPRRWGRARMRRYRRSATGPGNTKASPEGRPQGRLCMQRCRSGSVWPAARVRVLVLIRRVVILVGEVVWYHVQCGRLG